MVPELELEMVPVAVLTMPIKPEPVFETVSAPKLEREPPFWMPLLLPVFDTVSVPTMARVPPELIIMAIPAEFDKTKLTPVGIVTV